ncbi:hypothetical protein AMATHDRAFT_8751 [Amanita thiersii Skay4041]|uniref:Uncharacterized protein n=1 Tax=Amanita thiersii Skay4041 TaxID=703135 RepID=A0A2A9NDD8_9AGAR|nr:hypothetical protein AMATHDRAFT_8751 [Amanita thiersii Skay4041]
MDSPIGQFWFGHHRTSQASSEIKTQPSIESPESLSNIITFGVELIISGLERSSLTLAASHLKQIIGKINSAANLTDHLPDLIITSPDKMHAIDYVAVSLHSNLTAEPCPDLLVDIWQALQKYDFLSIDWRPSGGADRRRRIWYQAPDDNALPNLRHTIDSFLETHHIDHLPAFYM